MAKLTLTRFPDARDEYDAQQQAELIRDDSIKNELYLIGD